MHDERLTRPIRKVEGLCRILNGSLKIQKIKRHQIVINNIRSHFKHLAQSILVGLTLSTIVGIAIPTNAEEKPEQQSFDLRTWFHGGPKHHGRWSVSEDGSYVTQHINTYPTFFVSPDNFINTTIQGKFQVLTRDDNDFIGFIFGDNSPKDQPNIFDFLLFDWKQSKTSAPDGLEGLTLSKVNGIYGENLNVHNQFWHHQETENYDLLASQFGEHLGWRDYITYDFSLLYQTNRIKIDINGNTVFDISAKDAGYNKFKAGRFGFYNNSQGNVRYSGFTHVETPPESIPEPSVTLGLLTLGLMSFGSFIKRQKS